MKTIFLIGSLDEVLTHLDKYMSNKMISIISYESSVDDYGDVVIALKTIPCNTICNKVIYKSLCGHLTAPDIKTNIQLN